MIVEYVRYRIEDAGRRAAFERDYARAALLLDRAPQCLRYELSHGVEEPENYVLRIEWTSVQDHERGFRGGEHFPEFLAAVRPYISDIKEMKHYAPTTVRSVSPSPAERTAPSTEGQTAAESPPEPQSRPGTLAEAVGGLEGLRRLSRTFYEAVLTDPVLAPVFADFTPTHVEHVAVWLDEVFGGDTRFTDELGGHQALLKSHLGLGITEEQRHRWMELMTAAIDKELPEDALLRERLVGYVDWGTKIARDVSGEPSGTDLGDPGPTPRWGWDGLVE